MTTPLNTGASAAGERDHVAGVGKMVAELAREAQDWRHNGYTRVYLAQLHDRLASLSSASHSAAGESKTIEILRRALAWHGDPQRMATTREDWQQEVDAAIVWVKANPEPDRPSFSTLAALPATPAQARAVPEEVVRLREALQPFAELADSFEQAIEQDSRWTLEALSPDHRLTHFEPTWGQVKSARAAFSFGGDKG